ncbi:hypothetical protein Purlil1_3714 [Purpureocillium lilacinum]|uniref:Uncharacterized protein n=1 Tax=Purpureocillium lilacinum TaxID=33203 RepID=A0ABR0C6M1_PURLI|nr:hypothetical protein Purlil1_3714 [Purpureocillium lilacinum]
MPGEVDVGYFDSHFPAVKNSQSALTTHLPLPHSSSKARKLDDEQRGWHQAATGALGLNMVLDTPVAARSVTNKDEYRPRATPHRFLRARLAQQRPAAAMDGMLRRLVAAGCVCPLSDALAGRALPGQAVDPPPPPRQPRRLTSSRCRGSVSVKGPAPRVPTRLAGTAAETL